VVAFNDVDRPFAWPEESRRQTREAARDGHAKRGIWRDEDRVRVESALSSSLTASGSPVVPTSSAACVDLAISIAARVPFSDEKSMSTFARWASARSPRFDEIAQGLRRSGHRSKRIDACSHASTGSDDGNLELHKRFRFLRHHR
jgi:hypothetical protein